MRDADSLLIVLALECVVGVREEMARSVTSVALLLTAASWLGTTAFAQQEKVDVGKQEFEVHCAVCHGMDAKGHGSYDYNLEAAPSDLTLIVRSNGGVFPTDHLIEVIDGRAQIKSHDSREMPSTPKGIVIRVFAPDGAEQ